jgi:fumarylacetoacetate (FAA) hydrolase
MKLATLKRGGPDGTLVVVSRDLAWVVPVPDIALTLQRALDGWSSVAPRLEAISRGLNDGEIEAKMPLESKALAAPLPRAYQWLDGSAYLAHVARVRRARGAELPENATIDPLMYQGLSDGLLGPCDPILAASEDWGIDFEAEVAVITDLVPQGITAAKAGGHIRLLMLANDVTFRELIPSELAKGFGFLHSKPATAFSPVAVTPDELDPAWDGGKLQLPLVTRVNDQLFGRPDAGLDMAFDFPALIAHAAKTRQLGPGTIIGAGTVANQDPAVGCSCIVEKRALEMIDSGVAKTPYLRFGDRVRIEMRDKEENSVFGAIEQEVQCTPKA